MEPSSIFKINSIFSRSFNKYPGKLTFQFMLFQSENGSEIFTTPKNYLKLILIQLCDPKVADKFILFETEQKFFEEGLVLCQMSLFFCA